MEDIILIRTTLPSFEDVEKLSKALVESGLAACVQAYEVRSTYRWKGELCTTQEFALDIKASTFTQKEAIETIKKLHPYELPEIVVLSAKASDEYASWVNSTKKL